MSNLRHVLERNDIELRCFVILFSPFPGLNDLEQRGKKESLKILIEIFLVHIYYVIKITVLYTLISENIGRNFDNYAAGTRDSPTFAQLGADSLATTLFQL